MNFLGNELVFLEEERVNRWPDRRDRAVRRKQAGGEKICRPDRRPPRGGEFFERDR